MSEGRHDCPQCGAELDAIGCEKTTTCEKCGSKWKCGDGMESLVRGEENDPIYWDR